MYGSGDVIPMQCTQSFEGNVDMGDDAAQEAEEGVCHFSVPDVNPDLFLGNSTEELEKRENCPLVSSSHLRPSVLHTFTIVFSVLSPLPSLYSHPLPPCSLIPALSPLSSVLSPVSSLYCAGNSKFATCTCMYNYVHQVSCGFKLMRFIESSVHQNIFDSFTSI